MTGWLRRPLNGRRERLRTLAVGGVMVAALAGCGSGSVRSAPSTTKSAREVPSLRSYWTLRRLDLAHPAGSDDQVARQGLRLASESVRVGALFSTGTQGDHFCTASSVESPHGDLVITAAHCVDDPKNGGLRRNIAFVPAFRHGRTPYGVWAPKSFIIDPRWESSSDPDLDVAFIVLQPQSGKNVADVLGANAISFDTPYAQVVRVTGYPQTADAPITCVETTSKQSPTQLRFPCQGFAGGTSGSPWIVRPNTRAQTGTIVGVIGGYEQGGDTSDVSFSAYFGADIQRLYERAVAAS